MTSIDSIEGESIANCLVYAEATENMKEETHPVSIQEGPNTGTVRMQQQEALTKALSPNLREIPLLERIERVKKLIETHLKYDFCKDEAYVLCIEKLAPTHPHLAQEFIEKISAHRYNVQGYLTLAKYQTQEDALHSFQKAAQAFTNYDADTIFKHIDALFSKEDTSIQPFYREVHNALLKSYWNRSVADLILLAELEIRMDFPLAEERIQQAHEKEKSQKYQYPRDKLRLLELEARIQSPLALESLALSRTIAKNKGRRRFLAELIALEARHPFLSSAFREDFNTFLENKDLRDWECYQLLEEIAPYYPKEAAKLLDRINDGYYALRGWLELTQNSESNVSLFKEKLDTIYLDTEDFTRIFLLAAKVFGPKETSFIMDRAIESAKPDFGDLVRDEFKTTGIVFHHYLGKALGAEVPSLPKQEDFSRFSHIDGWDIGDILQGLSAYHLPGTEEVLEKMYNFANEDRLWDGDIILMIQAELNLGLNPPERSSGGDPA